ncbi:hypothetical protein LB456_10295 [Psychroflexus sp. CAK57W]|uniref:DUF6056 family protein n=1 Tax=Psychroflexus curvus TaxID=2873595 RepID=UPI001CCF04CF|nr:hypothetical protein [Psychroflexus curvus]MBZ9787844.1 hypothetical protein [Psychroflexus curvus]
MKEKYLLTLVGFLLIVFVFGPILFLTQFVYLSADDYCRAYRDLPYFLMIKEWYIGHNGRYVNAIISYLPIYNLWLYRLILALLAFAFVPVVFLFFKRIFLFYGIIPKISYLFLLTGVTSLFMISRLPAINEFFFWLAGATVYLIPLLALLIMTILTLGVNTFDKRRLLALSFLIIIVNGSNEMGAALLNAILFLILVYNLFLKNNFNYLRPLIILNIVSWLSSLPLLLAPGSENRIKYYPLAGDLLFSVYSSLLSSASFFIKKFSAIDFLIFSLIVLAICFLFSKPKKNKNVINPIILITISFLIFSAVLFSVYYATGHLAYNKGRIGNFIHLIFIFILIFNLVNIFAFFAQFKIEFSKTKRIKYVLTFLIPTFTYIAISSLNVKSLYGDIITQNVFEYKKAVEQRFEYLKNTEQNEIKLSPIKKLNSINNGDISRKVYEWENLCYKFYINKRFDKKIKSIKLE